MGPILPYPLLRGQPLKYFRHNRLKVHSDVYSVELLMIQNKSGRTEKTEQHAENNCSSLPYTGLFEQL